MGFLHKLWDETLAGPMPDSGLGKLRKYDSFSVRSSPPVDAAAANSIEDMNITRSITIVRTNSSKYLRNISVDPCSSPVSPATPSTPTTPLTRKLTIMCGFTWVKLTFRICQPINYCEWLFFFSICSLCLSLLWYFLLWCSQIRLLRWG
jgi:hypothetical protein